MGIVSIPLAMSDQPDPLRVLHDRLMAEMPEGASHDDCPICGEPVPNPTTSGGSMPETFTQEDIDAATAAATSPLQQRLAELEAQVQETEVGKAVTEAVAAEAAKLAELQTQLDAAEAARTAAESRLVETEQYWTDAIATHTEAVAMAARREQRVAAATDAGVFAADYITANADRFAAMSDEEFDTRLAEWALIASKAGVTAESATPITPARTALTASQADTKTPSSSLAYITEMRVNRVDPRTLGGVK